MGEPVDFIVKAYPVFPTHVVGSAGQVDKSDSIHLSPPSSHYGQDDNDMMGQIIDDACDIGITKALN